MGEAEREDWALIPAYQAEATLGTLLRAVSAHYPANRILVVDDGSADNGARIAAEAGAIVLRLSRNQGKGSALRAGFAYLLARNAGTIMIIDADLQHDPSRIPEFQEALRSADAGMASGRRNFSQGAMPFDRRFSNWCTSWLLKIITGQPIYDSQCGYRLIKGEVLRKLQLRSKKFEIETEMLLQVCHAGYKLSWVDIPTIYRGEMSSIRRLRDTLRFISLIGSHLISPRPSAR